MATRDVLAEWVTNRLMGDSTIGPLTGGRIFKGQIGHLTNPVYPLITFSRLAPGDTEPRVPASRYQMVFLVHSDKNFAEAWKLYEALKTSLDNERATSEDRSWVLREVTTPVEDTDPQPTLSYFVGTIFEVQQVG